MLERFCANFKPPKKSRAFFMKLVNGVMEARGEFDALIAQFSKNWDINRMSCVDRNVMRIAVFELLYCEDIPPKVSINEAVDVGKKFGTDKGTSIAGRRGTQGSWPRYETRNPKQLDSSGRSR